MHDEMAGLIKMPWATTIQTWTASKTSVIAQKTPELWQQRNNTHTTAARIAKATYLFMQFFNTFADKHIKHMLFVNKL